MINSRVARNFSKLHISAFLLPVILLLFIVGFLFQQNALSTEKYPLIQKECFLFLNKELSQFPDLMYNLTQFGDALVILSVVSVFIILAPKIWEAIIPASLFSLLFSKAFKTLFSVPRPAEILDHSSFTIVGKTLIGFSSLPSGHSITVFTIATVFMFGLMPKKLLEKFGWILLCVAFGLSVAFTRVGVGAHYPLDVISGSLVGYICGLLGIFTMRKFNLFGWISNKKWYPVLILIFLGGLFVLVGKIWKENLPVYYIAVTGLVLSLFKFAKAYVQK